MEYRKPRMDAKQREGRRMEALRRFRAGECAPSVAASLGVASNTVYTWGKPAREGDKAALKSVPKSGRPLDVPPFPIPDPTRELRASVPAAGPPSASLRSARQQRSNSHRLWYVNRGKAKRVYSRRWSAAEKTQPSCLSSRRSSEPLRLPSEPRR
jgi:hypothetical protein